jgi:hypothetical protein
MNLFQFRKKPIFLEYTQYTFPFDYEIHMNTFDQYAFSILSRLERTVCFQCIMHMKKMITSINIDDKYFSFYSIFLNFNHFLTFLHEIIPK